MVAWRLLITSFIAAVGTSLHVEGHNFASLLKRQEPGTPAYNCHDNCGTAITISKAGGDVCSNDVFLFDYRNCLQCAGPDNYNIWRYYGGSLNSVAVECGLDTEPLSGEQDDVPEAQHPGDSTGETSSSVATGASITATPTPTAAPVTTPGGETTAEDAPTTAQVTSATIGDASDSVTAAPTSTGAVSGSPSALGNGTASYTSGAPPEFTGAAATLQRLNGVTVIGFAAAVAVYGFGNYASRA
ncbi:hypothetical protein K458DRAFT_368570 [Lentithecium fluviatile CBS 122367]|uniref:Uncharacterized protein n=1 Tax=Lentithecium fluviatile CBS 122367 TaxID=1168545 RepID=A0A6G1IYK7_9PLEO|nr:hypothetical protein K458DRAFT_368570 [Lentithecium fluviatile CBS 122367]